MKATVYGEALLHVISDTEPLHSVAFGEVQIALGGPAAIVGAQIAQLGHDVEFIGATGVDLEGRLVEMLLTAAGVDCKRLVKSGSTTVVMALLGDDVRLVADPGDSFADSTWGCQLPAPLSTGPVYITAFPALLPAFEPLSVHRERVIADVGFKPLLADPSALLRHVAAAARLAATLVLSVSMLTDEDIVAVKETAFSCGVETLLLTRGAAGVRIISTGCDIEQDAFECAERDPLCAGDSFVGGFISGLLEGRTLLDAVRWGQAVAGAKIENIGKVATVTAANGVYTQTGLK